MREKFVVLLIGLCVGIFTFSQEITRVANSPYPVATQQPDKLYLTSENFSYSQKITLQSLQGMLARTKPEILRDTHKHVDLLPENITVDRSYYSNFNGLLAHFANRFDGYILCESKTHSVNVAFSLCPVLNAIAVPVDIEQAVINAGYAKLMDVRGKDGAWLLDNYGDHFNKDIVSYQAMNDDRTLFLGDYTIFAGAMQFWDDSAKGSLATRVYNRMNPSSVYFGWGAGEYETVEQISQRSAMILPSDWSPNLSTLSNIPAKLPRQKQQQTDYEVVPNVHTVCFVITDGDNIQWLSGSLNNKNNWDNPDKARLNLGWTISPSFAELAPISYKKYIENALTTEYGRNYLIAGPSGAGYYFPSIYPQLADQNKFMNHMMKKADLNIVNIIDKDGNHNPDEYLKQSNVDALFYYSYGGQYTKLAGQIKWYKDKPSIGGRFTLWGNSSDGSAEVRERVCQSLADKLNQQPTNIRQASGYSLIPVHIWTMNPTDVLNCISKLNPNVRVVSPDEFVWLIRKNLKSLDLGSGNGLLAEYALASKPSEIALSTTEATIDYDDEYSTAGTDAMGDNNFSVVWTGKVQAIYSENYTFHTTAHGAARLTINGQVLCDLPQGELSESSNTITLEAGKQYDIEFRYRKSGAKGLALLEWESNSQVRQRIPRYQLFSRPSPNIGYVTAYDEVNYAGYHGGLKLGAYDAAGLEKKGFSPQTIRSLQVKPGFKVILYDTDNFEGNSLELTADRADLDDWTAKIKSLQVVSNGADILADNESGGLFFIKPKHSVSIMGVDGGIQNAQNGRIVKLFRNTGAINLQFRFIPVADKIYRIECVYSNKSLEIKDFSKEEKANLQQWTKADVDNQQFILIETAEEGVYKIMACHSGKVLQVASMSTNAEVYQAEDTNQENALWELLPVPALSDGKGNGLTADYYNGKDFNVLQVSQIDETINFDWGTGRPHRNVNADNFSVRWQGKIQPRATGSYTFYVNSDNGRRLWVNDQLIIDKWLDDYDIEYSGSINLRDDQLYDIKLEYFESTGGAYCFLEWMNQMQAREIVPRSQLYSLDYDFSAVQNLQTASSFELYPNPAVDFVRIVTSGLMSDLPVQIHDISGRVVLSTTIRRNGNADTTIDISQLPAGIYFVSIPEAEREKIVKKLVVR